MKLPLLVGSLFLSTVLVAVWNKASHATKSRFSGLKTANSNSPQLSNVKLHSHLTEEENRELGYQGTIEITIWDLDDCHKGTGGPRCPEHEEENDNDEDGGDEEDDGGDEEEDGGDEDDTPSVDHLVACDGEIDADNVSVITIGWFFVVESSSEDPTNVAEEVCGVMSTAIIGEFDNKCASRRRLYERRLEIQGYSEKVTCYKVEECVPTNEESKSCAVYQADVEIAYDDEGENSSSEEVLDTVTDLAEDTLDGEGSDGIVATVNDALDDSESGDTLTNLGFGKDPKDQEDKDKADQEDKDKAVGAGLSGETYQDTSNQGLTRAGKMAIGFMSALILLLLLLCILCWRRHRKRQSDSKSIGTSDTQLSPARRGLGAGNSLQSLSDDDQTYLTSDFNNLGLHHSKLDVHTCASASCEQCNPINRENTNGVFFVNSKEGSPLSDIVEEEYKSSSGRVSPSSGRVSPDNGDSEVPPPPPARLPPPPSADETGEGKKKGFFSRFRRSKAPAPSEDPVVHAEMPTDGGADIEVEI